MIIVKDTFTNIMNAIENQIVKLGYFAASF